MRVTIGNELQDKELRVVASMEVYRHLSELVASCAEPTGQGSAPTRAALVVTQTTDDDRCERIIAHATRQHAETQNCPNRWQSI